MQKKPVEMVEMEIIEEFGRAQQIGRPSTTVFYRIGRLKERVYIIIDGVEPPGGRTTKKWIPVEGLRPLFDDWVRENEKLQLLPEHEHLQIAQFGSYFKPALPGNSTMSGRMVAILRKEKVLLLGNLVSIQLPKKYPQDYYFYNSVLNPRFGFDDFVKKWEDPKRHPPKKVEPVPVKKIFIPKTLYGSSPTLV